MEPDGKMAAGSIGTADGQGSGGEVVSHLSGASQARLCRYCRAVLPEKNRGTPLEFCQNTACRRNYWNRARRIGARVIEGGRNGGRRKKRARRDLTPADRRALLGLADSGWEC